MNCDGGVGGPDYALFTPMMALEPGPSGLDCADPLGSTAPCDADRDGDDVVDRLDNCVELAQGTGKFMDGDQDGIGNLCDCDLDNDGICTELDYGPIEACIGSTCYQNPDCCAADTNGDVIINHNDKQLVTNNLGFPPGPSGLSCADPLGTTIPCLPEP
jgi:hypothetical protein